MASGGTDLWVNEIPSLGSITVQTQNELIETTKYLRINFSTLKTSFYQA